MLDRDETRKKVMEGLKKLCDGGRTACNIGNTIGMSCFTVKNWKSGRRLPKLPVIRQIESVYGIKIL